MSKKEDVRFGFGENWKDYSNLISSRVIVTAKRSLLDWIPLRNFEGKKFLDIGSGSGLFSFAAYDLGADVFSFDYDQNCISCTEKMRALSSNHDKQTWEIERGDVLNDAYMAKHKGQYDIVYSWGVLHHTGNMMKALKKAGDCVREGGYLYISIYNDQGIASRIWRCVKRQYNTGSEYKKRLILFIGCLYLRGITATYELYTKKGKMKAMGPRGMDSWHDLVDWIGGYPFEYATADKIINFYLKRGFKLIKLKALEKKDLGCNHFVFEKN